MRNTHLPSKVSPMLVTYVAAGFCVICGCGSVAVYEVFGIVRKSIVKDKGGNKTNLMT